jgi:DNA polymerase elongation subunit (family B)
MKLRWGIAKDDVTPQDIFRLTNGSASDRAIVAKYCIQDCNLVHHLLNKIDVITGYIEMSNICNVPISFLVFRGQGIKLTSYVAKKCREKDTLLPDLDSSFGNDEGYEGAIVLPPKCSMYMDNPVACVDYASLYPSAMISNNLSPDSKVWTQEYDLEGTLLKENSGEYELPAGYDYVDVEFDTFQWRRTNAKSRATKVKTGKKICRFAQFPDERRAILPAILEELLKARKDTRARIKKEPDAFMRNILDKRQLAYKVTANSLYGQCGSKTSTFFEKDVAAATTATGRMMIIYAKRIIEEVYGDLVYNTANYGPVCCRAEYVYGDSVANYTPVYVKYQGNIMIYTIEELCNVFFGGVWIKCTEPGKQEKEVCNFPEGTVETWSENGWTPLQRVIRHKLAPHKKMFRILTHTGVVDVTDDHSLLTPDGTEIRPDMVSIGTELLHHFTPSFHISSTQISKGDAYRLGFIFRYDSEIPYDILYAEPEIRWAFVDGLYHSNMDSSGSGTFHIEQKSQLCATVIYNIAVSVGWDVFIDTDGDIYRLTMMYSEKTTNTSSLQLHPSKVKNIHVIAYPQGEYVYDLTTDNHHFAAGIGKMIVHNTDSVFFTFNLQNTDGEPIRGKPALEITIEIAQDVARLCTQYLKLPMELTYEKTLMPFILLSKKRYVGMLFENDAKGDGKLKYMGLSIKRRDSCDYLKEVYGRILNILMKEQNVMSAVTYLRTSLEQLIDGNVALDKLIITRALRSDYKNPLQIAHRVLADRIGERDPGNKPKSGDRMKFLFVTSPPSAKGKSVLMGDRIETPEYVLVGKAKIDYMYYITNQLMNPMTQLFGLALGDIYDGKQNTLLKYRGVVEQMKKQYGEDLEGFNKQKEKYCSREVERIVFEPILAKVVNQKNNQMGIMRFMKNTPH